MTILVARCRKCDSDYLPTANDARKHDWRCGDCRREYDAEWRRKRAAQGLRTGGTDTWAPEKRTAFNARYYEQPEVRERKARSGFIELTEYHPGENGHGESTWISVRHVLRVKKMHEFASDHVYTQLIFASGGHDNYYFVDVIEGPLMVLALMQDVEG